MRSVAAIVMLLLATCASAHVVRVGLTASGDSVVVAPPPQGMAASPWEGGAADVFRSVQGPLRFGVRAPSSTPSPTSLRYMVRVKQVRTMREARVIVRGLDPAVDVPLTVEAEGDGQLVVAGPIEARDKAEALAKRLKSAGMAAARVTELEKTDAVRPASRLVALTSRFDVREIPGEKLLLVAAGSAEGAWLDVGGTHYRGQIEISVDDADHLRVVNIVDLENYVRGVVPKELGPEVYPRLEAQAAQAVAARSYVIAEGSRHASLGYDVCPTAHCQVYGGATAEHPLSDEAVAMTANLILAYEGLPALTLFSSTCGGRTEAVENIFEGEPRPYLAGVACEPDAIPFASLKGRGAQADWRLVDGRNAELLLARLVAAGVVGEDELQARGFSKRARGDEAGRWLARTALALRQKLKHETATSLDVSSLRKLVSSFVAASDLAQREALLAGVDVEAASHFGELGGLSGEDLQAALVLMQAGILPPGLHEGWPAEKPSRGHVLELLGRWLEQGSGVQETTLRFLALEGATLVAQRGTSTERIACDEGTLLLAGRADSLPAAQHSLALKLFDKLFVTKRADGSAALIRLEEDPDGATYERNSAWTWWSQRVEFADIARRFDERADFAGVTDMALTKTSAAGRVIGIRGFDGAGGVKDVSGFEARQVMGLPELRADITLERDASGRMLGLRAVGRGWGHGVGLCQTGAYGMALAGMTHAQILAHYYPGTTLVPLESLRP